MSIYIYIYIYIKSGGWPQLSIVRSVYKQKTSIYREKGKQRIMGMYPKKRENSSQLKLGTNRVKPMGV